MNIMIIGAGGREHALAWKLSQDPRVKRLYMAPGNSGMEELEKCYCVPLKRCDELLNFAKHKHVDLTIVGSEALLVDGIVDRFKENNLAIFGPDQSAARLEGSKVFAKEFMQKYGVKTARYASFSQMDEALAYIENHPYPLVVKASGLAQGKGVIIAADQEQAREAIVSIMQDKRFGQAGNEIVIEEFLQGVEASILSFTDCRNILPMLSAKDHKKIGEGETGPNTGGMGAFAPNVFVTPQVMAAFERDILAPTLRGLQAEHMDFAGVIFFGLMICGEDVYLLEYNMRLGDPETQTILPLLENQLLEPIEAALAGELDRVQLRWQAQSAVCVVMASQGYPGSYEIGKLISNVSFARFFAHVFFAGIERRDDELVTNGGRVLNIVALGNTLEEARNNAYQAVSYIDFSGATYRRDIALLPKNNAPSI